MKLSERIKKYFEEKNNCPPELVVRASGRINLIGEHTDYNNGFVLPAAINKNIFLAFSKRQDNKVALYAYDLKEKISYTTASLMKSEKKWSNYITGVVHQLQKRQITVTGFNCVFGGDIPVGAGLSSSAALECGAAFGLNRLFNLSLSHLDIAVIGQQSENEFVGLQCGIMDPFASVFGKKNHFIKLDCRDLSYEYIPFVTDEYKIVLIDSGVKHELASGEYNVRRKECEEGVKVIQSDFPAVKSLREVTLSQLNAVKNKITPVVFKRCKYVIEENERVLLACKDLTNNDFISIGKKMFDAHEGLRNEYEVSCAEIDFLVDEAKKHSFVYGSRIMGGGFGGCTINLVKKEEIPYFISSIKKAYQPAFNKELTVYEVEISDGMGIEEI